MRMAPIECFPFAHGCPPKDNPMHDRVLLVKLRPPKIAFGFARYNVLNDVFQVCRDGFYQTENYAYTEYPAIGSYADRQKPSTKANTDDLYALMPDEFSYSMGPYCFLSYVTMEDVIMEAAKKQLFCSDVDAVLTSSNLYNQYLLEMDKGRFTIASVGRFLDNRIEFTAASPNIINENVYHMYGTVSRDRIRRVLSLRDTFDG